MRNRNREKVSKCKEQGGRVKGRESGRSQKEKEEGCEGDEDEKRKKEVIWKERERVRRQRK